MDARQVRNYTSFRVATIAESVGMASCEISESVTRTAPSDKGGWLDAGSCAACKNRRALSERSDVPDAANVAVFGTAERMLWPREFVARCECRN